MVFSNITISVFQVAGVVSFLFVLWYEGKKDGFDTDRLFDLGLILLVINYLLYCLVIRWYEHMRIFAYDSFWLQLDEFITFAVAGLLISTGIIKLVTAKFKWSIYRILDIVSLSFLAFYVFFLFEKTILKQHYSLLLAVFLLAVVNQYILRYRGYKLFSGLTFNVVSIFVVLTAFVFFENMPGELLLYLTLVTINLVILYFRRKRTMLKNYLPVELLNALRGKLLAKDKDLAEQQKLLVTQDPYMQPGRTEDNSETIDEAILEDSRKEVSDAQLSAVRKMRIQVRKALSLIHIGKYGICEECGAKIDKARLKFYPEATKCIKCASRE